MSESSKNQPIVNNDKKNAFLSTQKRVGIVLVQLGTPDEATPEAVRRYLREFLSDPHVVEANRVLWFFILNGIILTFRPKKSALLYERLFSTYGPVLKTYSTSLTKKMTPALKNAGVHSVSYAMRYGNPSLKTHLQEIARECTHLLVVPLFPQYSNSTTGSVQDLVQEELAKMRFKPTVRFMPPFYNTPEFIHGVARLMNEALQKRATPPDRILMSYHGIPKRYSDLGDPYGEMCKISTDLISLQLNYPKDKILHVYQSRFGKEPWLTPYLDETIEELAKSGVKDLVIASPAFTMDCLETLDEIGYETRKKFLALGGSRLELVSCLNDHDFWAESFSALLIKELGGWI